MDILLHARKRVAALKVQITAWLVQLGHSKSWLVLLMVVYSLLCAVYFIVWDDASLKYAITIGGILLATVIREVANKDWKTLRVVAICLPVVAVAIVQAVDSYKASLIAQQAQLENERARSRDREAQMREALVLDPRDTIDSIQNADGGFLTKADLLALQAAAKVAQLASLSPTMSAELSRLPPDLQAQVGAYQSLRATQPVGDRPAAGKLIDDIVRLLTLQASYRNAAEELRNEVKPQYEKMLALKERGSDANSEFQAMLAAVTAQVSESANRYQIAGMHNHAGVLAMASGQSKRALSHFYKALDLEPEHLPAYESLGYALWSVNRDAYGALNLASAGLTEYGRVRAELDAGKKIVTVRISTPGAREAVMDFLDNMSVLLKLQYAYFSALQYQNENQAMAYASDILKLNPNDAEYQDTWGFVLMRFANGRLELEEAIELFDKASRNPDAERITKGLASAHLQQANDLLTRLKG